MQTRPIESSAWDEECKYKVGNCNQKIETFLCLVYVIQLPVQKVGCVFWPSWSAALADAQVGSSLIAVVGIIITVIGIQCKLISSGHHHSHATLWWLVVKQLAE